MGGRRFFGRRFRILLANFFPFTVRCRRWKILSRGRVGDFGSLEGKGACLLGPPVWFPSLVGSASASGFEDFSSFVHSLIHVIVRSSLSCSVRDVACSCHVHLRPRGQLILTSLSGLLVLYFPVILFIPFMPCLKISFFLPMSLLSSRLFCFRFSLSISFSALPISTVRRAFHLSCCLTSFWKVGLRWRNPNPCMAFRVAPLILSLGCSGAVSVSAAFSKEILCNRVFCVLFLCSFLSPARLRAFQDFSCSHLTSFARIFCSLWIRSASAWPVGFSTKSPGICVSIRAFQLSTCRLKKTVSIRWEKSGGVVRAGLASLGKSKWGSWVHMWLWSNFLWDLGFGSVIWGGR